MELERAVFRFVEHELYSYDLLADQLAALKDDIYSGRPAEGARPESNRRPGNPTEAKGIRLVSDVAVLHITRTIQAIDVGLSRLTDDHRTIFDLKYRRAYDWIAVCEAMPISRSAYYKLRRELVEMVAYQLGLI